MKSKRVLIIFAILIFFSIIAIVFYFLNNKKNNECSNCISEDCLLKYPVLDKVYLDNQKLYCDYQAGKIKNKKLNLLIITKEEGSLYTEEFIKIGGKTNLTLGPRIYGNIDLKNLIILLEKDWCQNVISQPSAIDLY